jgi:threonyl-tRNA synthetase
MTDSLGRSWQLGTVQLDYLMPERFGCVHTGADNAEHPTVMIHRAMFGSFERFIGLLIEHTAGELPVWLTPVQAIALPIADRHVDAAQVAVQALRARGVREAESGAVSLRRHTEGDLGSATIDEVVARLDAQTPDGAR